MVTIIHHPLGLIPTCMPKYMTSSKCGKNMAWWKIRTTDCGLGLRTRIADSDYGLGLRTRIADYGLQTRIADSDCGLRIAEKSEHGVHSFTLTRSQHKFVFLCKNMYFKHNMEYQYLNFLTNCYFQHLVIG